MCTYVLYRIGDASSSDFGRMVKCFPQKRITFEGACGLVSGPRLVKAATDKVISAEELGGAETHRCRSGVVDLVTRPMTFAS